MCLTALTVRLDGHVFLMYYQLETRSSHSTAVSERKGAANLSVCLATLPMFEQGPGHSVTPAASHPPQNSTIQSSATADTAEHLIERGPMPEPIEADEIQ